MEYSIGIAYSAIEKIVLGGMLPTVDEQNARVWHSKTESACLNTAIEQVLNEITLIGKY